MFALLRAPSLKHDTAMVHAVSTEFKPAKDSLGHKPQTTVFIDSFRFWVAPSRQRSSKSWLIKSQKLALLLPPQLEPKETCVCRSELLLLHLSATHTKSFHPLGNSYVAGLHQKRQSDREWPRLLIAFLLCLAWYFLWPFHNTFGTSQFDCQSVCVTLLWAFHPQVSSYCKIF